MILSCFVLVPLIRCTSKNDNVNQPIKIDFKPHFNFVQYSAYPLIHPTSYFGEWRYSFPFYSSELFINRDGTFKFHEQGCTGHGYSEGRWTTSAGDILLTSFENYSLNKPAIVEIKSGPEPATSKRKNKTQFLLDSLIEVSYRSSDTSNVYFNNVRFTLEEDILYRLNDDASREGSAFILTKNL